MYMCVCLHISTCVHIFIFVSVYIRYLRIFPHDYRYFIASRTWKHSVWCVFVYVSMCMYMCSYTYKLTYIHTLPLSFKRHFNSLFFDLFNSVSKITLDIIQNFLFFSYYHPVFHCLRRKWKKNFAFL